MRRKRVKGYWQKCKEKFKTGSEAKSRAGMLRLNEHIAHVLVDKVGENYVVAYSVAKWYLEDAKRAGIKI